MLYILTVIQRDREQFRIEIMQVVKTFFTSCVSCLMKKVLNNDSYEWGGGRGGVRGRLYVTVG